MSKKTIYLLGMLFTMILGAWLYTLFCCCCCKTSDAVDSNQDDPDRSRKKETISSVVNQKTKTNSDLGFGFKINGNEFHCSDNFSFPFSKANLITPVSDSIRLGIDALKKNLVNSNENFTITGLYSSKEENTSIFSDLGLARANAIKNFLVSNGIPEKKLKVASELMNEGFPIDKEIVLQGGKYEWDLGAVNSNETKDWLVVKNKINAEPLRLYFLTGQATIYLKKNEKEKIAAIVDYLNHVPHSKILIEGHTDNVVGTRNTNEYYSVERAKFVQQFFIANNIPASKIEIAGRGDTKPIESNDTEDGRAKNRRAEVTLK